MAINYSGVVQNGTLASRPAASTAGPCMYYATDTGLLYTSDGATWSTVVSSTGWLTILNKDFTDGASNQTFSDADNAFHNVTIDAKTWVTASGTGVGGNINGAVSGATWGIDANGLNIALKAGNVTSRDCGIYVPTTTLNAAALIGRGMRVWVMYATTGETSPVAAGLINLRAGFSWGARTAPTILSAPRVVIQRAINTLYTYLAPANVVGTATQTADGVLPPANTDVLVCTLTPAMSIIAQTGVSVAGALPAESALTLIDTIPQLGVGAAGGNLAAQTLLAVALSYTNSTVQTPKLTVKRMLVEIPY